jgi:hypothetical protein
MKLVRLFVPLAAGAVLYACNADQGDCAGALGYAVHADITDSVSGAPLAYRASLIIRDGSFVDSVPFNSTVVDSARVPTLLAGRDREGTYDVTVRREGSRVWTRANVTARRDRCGDLKGAVLTVRLQPAA